MAVVAFWSQENKETGQTLSQVALSTYMAIEHNYKILNISTSFKDTTMEDCYWDLQKQINLVKNLTNSNQVGLESGVEGLVKIINSNKTSVNIVSNYAKISMKKRRSSSCVERLCSVSKYNSYGELCQ